MRLRLRLSLRTEALGWGSRRVLLLLLLLLLLVVASRPEVRLHMLMRVSFATEALLASLN